MEKAELSYRGFMLDSARHFIPVENVLKIVEAAAKCGLNRMHWHLCDDQGWRVEIRRYPKLTKIGAKRGKSCFWGEDEYENNNGYYTQKDVKRIVAFARGQGMEIVPEIEVPGHASAMLAAYPEFGCRRQDGDRITDHPYNYEVITCAGVFPNLICAGREDSVGFLENILDEICDLFPGPEVHIGGDEAVKMHWRRCPDCQRRMAENGLKDENELQRWLVLRMGAFLKARGKQTIVWNESLDGGLLPDNFIVQHWWGNDKETAEFMAKGGKVICSDVSQYYISRPYFSLSAYKVWQHVTPRYAEGNEDKLLGLECPVWGERINNPARAEYLLFPRAAIVAMKAKGEAGSWPNCVKQLEKLMAETADLNINWAPREDWCPGRAEKKRMFDLEKAKRNLPGMPRVFEVNDFIIRQEALEKLLGRIGMPKEFARDVMDSVWQELKEYACMPEREYAKGARELADQLLTALAQRESGAWHGIDDRVWIDTLKCFTRFVNEHRRTYGVYGFDRGFWTTRQVNGKLFRLGELEYELKEDGGVDIHIPSDACLEAEKLNDSVKNARSFLKERFPQYADAPFCCETWLLSPEIAALLGPDARIVKFQKAFEPIEQAGECIGALMEWVYRLPAGKRENADFGTLCEDTRLQKALKAHLAQGKTVHAGRGVLKRAF